MRVKKEKVCTLVFGVIGTFTILLVVSGSVGENYYSLFFALGIAFYAYAFALSPNVLFERVTFTRRGGTNLVLYGGAAILSVLGNLFLLLSAIFWALV